jgi:hypothetical protein
MTQTDGLPRPDTSDMISVHRALSGAIRSAPGLIGRVPAGDTDRSAVIGSYCDNVLRFLEVHHVGEDELLTPLLQERCTNEDAALVQRIGDQHRDVHEPIHDAGRALHPWAESADPAAAAGLTAALGRLDDVLNPHLVDEEAHVLPLAATHLTAPEWGAMAEHGMKSFAGDDLWLILGLIHESMTEQQRVAMLTHMPPPLADAWRNSGRATFEATIGEVRGHS